MDDIRNKDGLKLNQRAYILESMFEYFISILTSGAYLAKLTTTIGISDAMTAILSAVASLAAMFQVFSIFLAHKTPVKKWVLPTTVIPQALIATLYLIPFFNIGAVAPIIFFIIILVNGAARNIVAPAKADWFVSPIESKKRGQFQATMSIVSIIGGTVFTFIAGLTIDKYEAEGNLVTLFTVLSVIIFIMSMLQMVCLLVSKCDQPKVEKKESPFKSLKSVVKNKAFIRVTILTSIWSVANSITTPFLSTYQIKELGFSMSFISTVTVALNFLNILILFLVGKFSSKHSYSSTFIISYIFGLIAFGVIIFTTTSNGHVLFTLHRLISVIFGSFSGVSSIALIFAVVSEGERTAALAFKSIVTGLFGFVTTLLATPIFTAIQSADITLFGKTVYAQQILALISFIITALLILYYQFFCRRIIKEAEKG